MKNIYIRPDSIAITPFKKMLLEMFTFIVVGLHINLYDTRNIDLPYTYYAYKHINIYSIILLILCSCFSILTVYIYYT